MPVIIGASLCFWLVTIYEVCIKCILCMSLEGTGIPR